MPCQARIDTPGALHHIICRGIECRKIFRGKKDYGDFVDDIFKEAEEYYHQRQALRSRGNTLAHLLPVAARITEVSLQEILKPGKDRQRVRARSLFCYWAVRELGMIMTEMSRFSGPSVPAISMAVERGEKFAHELNFSLPELMKLKT